jgi:hypothetical protein
LEAFARRFELIRDAVEAGFAPHGGPRALVGISMGGRQALYLALRGVIPDIAAVGVLSGKLQPPYAEELATLVGGWDPQAIAGLRLYFHYCGRGGTDERFLEGNRLVCKGLGKELRTREGADHNWWFWRPQLAAFFRAFTKATAEQARPSCITDRIERIDFSRPSPNREPFAQSTSSGSRHRCQ